MGGEAGKVAAGDEKVSEHVKKSFSTMRLIVTIGWSIYPLGYFFGYLQGKVKADDLNLIYNVADVINKIAFFSPSGHPQWLTPLRSTAELLCSLHFVCCFVAASSKACTSFQPWARYYSAPSVLFLRG